MATVTRHLKLINKNVTKRIKVHKKGNRGIWYPEESVAPYAVNLARFYHLRMLPGLNVQLTKNRTLRSLEAGQVVVTLEKTNLDWNKVLVQHHFPHLKGNDANFYFPYIHVIPKPQHQNFRLIDQT
ncbi:unnamed protein product [Darwinula stevensoni]|uniref:Uncharacterized protein n=1 Tax=Darwinula stevensoni TaxID=69355 RepID=A0A7R8X166_9CRUS|nr:unnamed protein product [Darwinula stevensoni]CAG0881924.1 unnamed protein product [Darwinula stevensoni]